MANEDFMIELLKRIQADTAGARRRAENIEIRMSAMDDYMRGMPTALGGIQSDLQQINGRVERIERRLDLVDA